MENYKNVLQDIRDQLNAEAEAVQIILTGIDNDIYSTIDACPNACEMWKAIEFGKLTSRDGESLESYYSRSQQAATRNRGKAIVNSPPPTYDQEPKMVVKDDALLKEKKIDKLIALIYLSFKKIYKPINNNLRTSSNTSRANQDNTPRINTGAGHVARECQKPKQEKDAAYHKEKMLLYAADNFRPVFDAKPLQKVQNDNDNYNAFANDSEHREQPKSVNDTYPDEQGDTNIPTDSLDMSNNGGHADQDEDDDLAKERDLLASLIDKLKLDCWMAMKEIEDRLLKEIEKFGWWFEQDISGDSGDDKEKTLVIMNEEEWMS
ncbi:hypothetical protein Tco_0713619 [Tanacetum coccineum]